jgi:diguanylate cyclase (GGDEF)-like protein
LTVLPASHCADVGVWEWELVTDRMSWNDGVYEMFGLPPGTPLQRSAMLQMFHDDCRIRLETLWAHIIGQGGSFTLEARIWAEGRGLRWLRINAGVMLANGLPTRLVGSMQDITAERDAWDRLRQRAEFDALTGLPNRWCFEELWHAILTGQQENISSLGVVDIDNFKQINDCFGHPAGDECLRVTADRLRRVMGEYGAAMRYGGDEFVFVVQGTRRRAFFERLLGALQTALCEPVVWQGQSLVLSVSIGVATRAWRESPRDMFSRADAALYQAKQGGRSMTVIDGRVLTPEVKDDPVGSRYSSPRA